MCHLPQVEKYNEVYKCKRTKSESDEVLLVGQLLKDSSNRS